ncbi:hypothetical protein AB4Z42_02505 [Mycobacterium sp. 2YAF39]|uniref:hypothetical protein n=1 Tax=Mycobacterium sp. 2YAF39 TaxID=3233033 RepID=UPI003F995D13
MPHLVSAARPVRYPRTAAHPIAGSSCIATMLATRLQTTFLCDALIVWDLKQSIKRCR